MKRDIFKNIAVLLIFILLLIWGQAAVLASSDRLQTFEQKIESLREELNIPGMSVAILQGQEIIFNQGFGYADVENKIPATENTPYHIASLTKPFGAALIMQLVEENKLNLDSEMKDVLKDSVLPPLPLDDKPHQGYASACDRMIELQKDNAYPIAFLLQDFNCNTEQITVRHHLTHTSQGTPGEKYRYNGLLYAFLTFVVEAASEENFKEQLVKKIIEPLGMTRTFPGNNDNVNTQVLKDCAKPYQADKDGNPVLSNFDYTEGAIYASAGMISTVLDLAKFDIAMDQNLLVSEESKVEMFTSTLANSGQSLPYGLGWFVQVYEDTKLIWHYGYEPGAYSSLILKIPEKETTLILLANSDGASASFGLEEGNVLNSPFAVEFINLFTEIEILL